MSVRELVILGTSSQVPTRFRNHNGAFLRWDDAGLIFDPGEGTQRQMTRYGVRASAIHHLCLTHFHGDHCLGVPGVVQRLSLDGVEHPVHAWYPASGAHYFARLRQASIFDERATLVEHGITQAGPQHTTSAFTLSALPLEHRCETYGYRLQEPDGITLLPDRLAAVGLRGPAVGELLRNGQVQTPSGQTIHVDEVGVRRRGQSFAFVMDTRLCENAVELARDVDLLVTESTFLSEEQDLARQYFHMTAHDAATLAREAGARRLVLTHFSQRHPDNRVFGDEASAVFADVVTAEDGVVVPVPPRVRASDVSNA